MDEEHKHIGPMQATQFPWVTDINEHTAVMFHEQMLQNFEENPYKPVVIHISSYGGEVDSLFSMLDTIDVIRSVAPEEFQIITVAMGKAHSAGAVLLSYGDIRCATPFSRIMLHQVISQTGGSQPANEVEFSEISRMNTNMLQVLKKRCRSNLSMKEFKEKLSHNLYLTPNKAKELGLIDIVGYPKVLEKTIYDIAVLNEGPKDANRRTNKKAPTHQGKD